MQEHSLAQWILGTLIVIFSLGVILASKPVHSCLSFLATLIFLAAYYLQMSAQFIAVMQILVYAGAILVIFMFVIILFQDAYLKISEYPPQSNPWFLIASATAFVLALTFFGSRLLRFPTSNQPLPKDFGTVEALGQGLYLDFFFPFEAVVLLFLIAVIGAVYIGKKGA